MRNKTLEKRIKDMSGWLSLYLVRMGYHINYKAESYKEIDRFFDEHMESSILKDNDAYLFAIASYIGEVLRLRPYNHAKWHYENYKNDNKDDRSIYIKYASGKIVYPFEAVALRMQGKMLIQNIIRYY